MHFHISRRELLWPELDQLLRDENDVSGASTPYMAAVPEYRIVFVKPEETSYLEKSWNLANGHASHDIHHPCRYKFLYSQVPCTNSRIN